MTTINELDKSADNLIKEYQRVYTYIIKSLKYQIDNGLSKNQARSILRGIQLELKQLDKKAYQWSYKVLPKYYYLSLKNVDIDAEMLSNVNVIGGSLIVMHTRAIQVAADSLYTDLAKNTQHMSEQAKKIIRENGKELINRQVISGESQRKTKKELKKALIKNGVTSFVDAGKKEWQIDKYASMVVRTKSRLIHNRGTMNRLSEYRQNYPMNPNFDFIQISNHGAKDWCGKYESTVWSISGNDTDYPSVSGLPNYPYESLHPNCKHIYLSYMIELRGKGNAVSKKYLNKSIKDLNKEDYHKRKAM